MKMTADSKTELRQRNRDSDKIGTENSMDFKVNILSGVWYTKI